MNYLERFDVSAASLNMWMALSDQCRLRSRSTFSKMMRYRSKAGVKSKAPGRGVRSSPHKRDRGFPLFEMTALDSYLRENEQITR